MNTQALDIANRRARLRGSAVRNADIGITDDHIAAVAPRLDGSEVAMLAAAAATRYRIIADFRRSHSPRRRSAPGSTSSQQDIENQLRELHQIAKRRGWEVVHEYRDAGINGAKGREARPGLDEMLNDAQRRRFDIVMAWADRPAGSFTA
jgi:Resolvase, N terminal domain